MFGDLYDAMSLLWSWRWPVTEGEVTAVGGDTARLAVAYEFSVGDDGPRIQANAFGILDFVQ